MARPHRPSGRDGFEIAIICALPIERNAVEALLDEEYETDGFSYGKAAGDSNAYTTGRLGNQHVVLAYMPGMGMISAAAVAANILSSFERIKVGIVVGICGGVPTSTDGAEIVLGDVIISTSVIQIDFGRQHPNKFIRKKTVEDTLGRANPEIRAVVGKASGYLVRGRLKDKTSLSLLTSARGMGLINRPIRVQRTTHFTRLTIGTSIECKAAASSVTIATTKMMKCANLH
jgi:nucleoside phosphorylase